VFVDRPGIINYDKIWAAGLTDDDILRFHISEMEVCQWCEAVSGRRQRSGTLRCILILPFVVAEFAGRPSDTASLS
jgi:hypothetical protein